MNAYDWIALTCGTTAGFLYAYFYYVVPKTLSPPWRTAVAFLLMGVSICIALIVAICFTMLLDL